MSVWTWAKCCACAAVSACFICSGTVFASPCPRLSALANKTVDIEVMTASRTGWDGRNLPLWSERVIAALYAGHPLSKKEVVRWPDLTGETILLPHNGPGAELERLLFRGMEIMARNEFCGRKVWLGRSNLLTDIFRICKLGDGRCRQPLASVRIR